jgi:hypothetical protein
VGGGGRNDPSLYAHMNNKTIKEKEFEWALKEKERQKKEKKKRKKKQKQNNINAGFKSIFRFWNMYYS